MDGIITPTPSIAIIQMFFPRNIRFSGIKVNKANVY
jgi:hypothetical protein